MEVNFSYCASAIIWNILESSLFTDTMVTVFVNEKATRIELLKSECEKEKEGRGWSRHLKREALSI